MILEKYILYEKNRNHHRGDIRNSNFTFSLSHVSIEEMIKLPSVGVRLSVRSSFVSLFVEGVSVVSILYVVFRAIIMPVCCNNVVSIL